MALNIWTVWNILHSTERAKSTLNALFYPPSIPCSIGVMLCCWSKSTLCHRSEWQNVFIGEIGAHVHKTLAFCWKIFEHRIPTLKVPNDTSHLYHACQIVSIERKRIDKFPEFHLFFSIYVVINCWFSLNEQSQFI